MLLTKEADYKVNSRSLKYYRDLGYECNIGDIIKVKVEDLKEFSSCLVKYQCDRCGRIFEIPFRSFSHCHKINEMTYCVECANKNIFEEKVKEKEKYLPKDGYKLCSSCNRTLPANSDYFNHKHDTKDGFTNWCKECLGRKFTDHLTRIPKSGYKFCKKCDRELPANQMYFPTDNSCIGGIRSVCRECDKKYGKFLDKMPQKSEPWSKEDIEFLKSIYADYTNEEIVEKFFPNRTIRSLESTADKFGFSGKSEETYKRSCIARAIKCSEKNKGRVMSDETRQKLSVIRKEYYKTHSSPMKGKKLSDDRRREISLRNKGKWSGNKNPRVANPYKGKDNPNWRGGITALYQELRSDTKEWFMKSAEFSNYNCIITGKNFDNVHHLYPFKNIVEEVFNNLNIDRRENVSEYSDDELIAIRNELLRLHDFYGYGCPINKKVHKLFHDLYGYKETNYFDFLEFIKRIEIGEFNEWFVENKLSININYDYIDYIKEIIKQVG